VREIRRFLEDRGFAEVRRQFYKRSPARGGGAVQHAPQTPGSILSADRAGALLETSLVGGSQSVRTKPNFRNEGISRKHNPGIHHARSLPAYADFEKMADLIEELICNAAEKICGSLESSIAAWTEKVVRTINLKRPWRRARYVDLVREWRAKIG